MLVQKFPLSLANLSFITFNYDRCIGKYLLNYAAHTLFKSVEQVAGSVGEVPVLHPFGQLGALEHLGALGSAEVRFGEDDPRYLWPAARGIKTFTEELDSAHGQRVRQQVDTARTVVFLGFQYHEPNMRILFGETGLRGKRVFGTTFGMSDRRKLQLQGSLQNNGNTVTLASMKCDAFIAQYGEEIFES